MQSYFSSAPHNKCLHHMQSKTLLEKAAKPKIALGKLFPKK